ncbi:MULTISPECIES: tetratricopeptide repeat protein [unclassified Microcoleus]|uniref:tetratricopeptide repeat protein n=1 Tax=unclassified Microcoleus TaxID=2642155 RepID=UPI001D41944E|nr:MULTISPECIES: tetratricopeptide repeat protein [unclassified Microcoleus]MCC3465764.1 tetratricopeptide repeat protein [Microcoleus sp. PH2017_06_SFM_O_A]MCC3503152.1 tetratricopeptide repeat protein [Microcoleus sp. PH2017_19_SFW_U_A]TAE43664.1 MAG: tetratricopeptide repeat protein [Oscillatoriales cyanobacterium]MCC3411325.1 tetratricopeptide repeat protein [Microcoleus sp. PH2017_02_FOX_O_A]MCC3490875.1 tetratricopeptide repeat protein [Microcoleus sp. PH2017_16_JOR_D_A]
MTINYFQTANQLKQQGKFLEAIDFYQMAIKQNPSFHWCYHNLGETFTKLSRYDEAIKCFQAAIEINPKASTSYYNLAELLYKIENLNEANIAYYNAIKINPDLGVNLAKQGRLSQIIACFDYVLKGDPHYAMVYYDFSRYLAEKDLMDQAIGCFQKAPQFSHNQEVDNQTNQDKFPEAVEENYEGLWKKLNQLGESDDIYESLPTKAEAQAYFDKNSNYTIIDLNNLTDLDRKLFTDNGISLDNLQITKKDDINLQEIYINSFHPTSKVKLSRKYVETVSELWEFSKNHACSKAIVETGYIYSLCPFSGEILRSNQSFYINYGNSLLMHAYRFVGKEIFYLVIGNICRGKMCIYVPRKSLIIKFSPDWLLSNEITKIINILKSSLVSSYQKVKFYIQTEIPKKIVFDLGFNKSIGHYYWNDLSGILYLQSNDILDKIEKFLVGNKEFFNISSVFPEIPSHKITKLANNEELFQTIIDNNYFAVQVNDLFISQNLADRVTQFSLEKSSENREFLEEVKMAKQNFPLLSIQIRSSRTWASQVEGNANIIKKLAEDFPNLGVVFDGWSRLEVEDFHSELMIAKDLDIMNQIIALLPPNIKTYCGIGGTTGEKVVLAHAIDVYSAPLGSGMSRLIWIATKPGVTHSHTDYYDMDWVKDHLESSLIRENIIPPRWVHRNYIVDLPGRNYDCDWSVIYEELVKIVREVSAR